MRRWGGLVLLAVLGGCAAPARPEVQRPRPEPVADGPTVASMDTPAPRAGPALRSALAELGPDHETRLSLYLAAALTDDPAAVDVLVRGLAHPGACPAAALAVGFLPRELAGRPLWLALRARCAEAALLAAEALGEREAVLEAARGGVLGCGPLARAVATGLAPGLVAPLAEASESGRCSDEAVREARTGLAVAGREAAALELVRSLPDLPSGQVPRELRLAFGRPEAEDLDRWVERLLGRAPGLPEEVWAAALGGVRPGSRLRPALALAAARALEPPCLPRSEGRAVPASCIAPRRALVALAVHPETPPEVPGLERLGFRIPTGEDEDLEEPAVVAAALRLRRGDPVVRVALDLALGDPDDPSPSLVSFLERYRLGGASERLARWRSSGRGEVCAALVEAGRLEDAMPALDRPEDVPACLVPAARALAAVEDEAASAALARVAGTIGTPGCRRAALAAALELRRRRLHPPRWTRDPVSLGLALEETLAGHLAWAGPAAGAPTPAEQLDLAELRAAVRRLAGAAREARTAGRPVLLLRDLRTVFPATEGRARRDVATLALAEAPGRAVLRRLDGEAAAELEAEAVLAMAPLRDAVVRRGRPAELAARALREPGLDPAAGVPLLVDGEHALAPLVALCDRRCREPLAELAARDDVPREVRRRAMLVLGADLSPEAGERLLRLGARASEELELHRAVAGGLARVPELATDPRGELLRRLVAGPEPALHALLEPRDAREGAARDPSPADPDERTGQLDDPALGQRLAAADLSTLGLVAWALRAGAHLAAEAPGEAAEAGAALALLIAAELEGASPARAPEPPPALLVAARRPGLPRVRAAALAAVAAWRRPEDRATLVEAATTREPDDDVRAAALRALATWGGPEVDAAIRAAASDPSPAVRLAAADAATDRGLLDVAGAVAHRDGGAAADRLGRASSAWLDFLADDARGPEPAETLSPPGAAP